MSGAAGNSQNQLDICYSSMIFFVLYIVIRTKYETTNITVPRHSGLILGANE